MQEGPKTAPDLNIMSVWQAQVAQAAENPGLRQQLLHRESELLPRFAEHYEKLKHLPRRMRRSLQRHWKQSLAGVALLLALGAVPASAATINVGGVCTLIRAINAANNDTTATGHCKKGSGADLIVMPRNSTVTLTSVNNTVNNSAFGATGLPAIRGAVTIDGNGSAIRRAASAPEFRIFTVFPGGNLRLQESTVSGGSAVRDVDDYGGGGFFNYGVLTLVNTIVSGNKAGSGGGVYDHDSFNTVNIINSTLSGNSATGGNGGGLYIGDSDTANITNSTISNNTASHDGGGICNCDDFTRVTISNSTLSGNKAVNGGGLATYSGGTIMTNSTFSGNKASSNGGGVYTGFSGVVGISNSTISGNIAASGGGVFNDHDGLIGLTNSTVSGNVARSGAGGGVYNAKDHIYYATVNLVHTIISGNTAPRGREVFNAKNKYDASSIVTAADFNIFGHKGLTNAQAFVGVAPSGTDITATSNGNRPTALNRILNTTLANNGGATRTHALVAGSPAVDAVNDGTCPPPARDQRGVKRPRDGNGDGGPACDVGSFER